ncbi:fungal-specific transcription factor domain-containing protein [Aspergillus ambiguus]|uniref:transcription factor domain-containing protein n=1 Tax=Aspergillus ambiguus TaxID=176160 RepID=UPI003CCD4039
MTRDTREPSKRRRNRVPVSCINCRSLKTKCDGIRPVCSTCSSHERDCAFDQPGRSGRASKSVLISCPNIVEVVFANKTSSYLQSLERRLGFLERNSDLNKTVLDPPAPSRQESADASAQKDSSSVVVDANVSIGGVSFPQMILSALYGHNKIQAQSIETSHDVRTSYLSLLEVDLYSLPSNASEILDRFFNFRHVLGPLFHVPTVRPRLEATLQCPIQERPRYRSEFVLLNMIFALCTSHWSMRNSAAAREHYDIAMMLMQPTLLRDWTLEHVQSLAIATRYLQGSNASIECWNVLGLAIRVAYGLRLHQEPLDTEPPPIRETKRRVWYALYTLDMHLSMIYGRPPMTRLTDFSVHPPEDLDDHCICDDKLLYPMPKRPSMMSFTIQVIKLYQIVEKVLENLPQNTDDRGKIMEMVITRDKEYQEWHSALPPHLVLDPNDAKEPPWILALRGNMVRILIHRQSLVATLHILIKPQQMEDPLVTQNLQYSRRICVSAAMDTVGIVALRHEQTKQTMGLDWYNVYYLFNAVIVLVSHVVDPTYSNDKPALSRVDKALHMIKAMADNHSFAHRAYTFLQRMLDYMHRAMASRQERCVNNVSINLTSPSYHNIATPLCVENETDPAPPGLDDLFGFTRVLTDDLETRLEDLDPTNLDDLLWQFNELHSFPIAL